MSQKHSAANKRVWARKSDAEKTNIMSAKAKLRMAKLTPAQRSMIAKNLVKAREAKRALIK